MAKKLYEEGYIKAIAHKIREKTGSDTAYKTSEMPSGIDEVYAKGYKQGESDCYEIMLPDLDRAYQDGYTVGLGEGYEQGEKSGYNWFWDIFQNDGNRTFYECAFANSGWNNKIFKPKYDLKPDSCYMMFRNTGLEGDLTEILSNLGITLDTSSAKNFNYMFMQATKITKIGLLDLSSVTTSANTTDSMFHTCRALKEIELIRTSNGEFKKFAASMFRNCTALEEVRFEGTISNTLDIRYSPLSRDSFVNIFNVLSSDCTEQIIYLSLNAVNRAFSPTGNYDDGSTSADWAELVATRPNWTVTLE